MAEPRTWTRVERKPQADEIEPGRRVPDDWNKALFIPWRLWRAQQVQARRNQVRIAAYHAETRGRR